MAQQRFRRHAGGAKDLAHLCPDLAAPLPRTPPLPGTPPAPPGDTDGNESYEIEGMPSTCV